MDGINEQKESISNNDTPVVTNNKSGVQHSVAVRDNFNGNSLSSINLFDNEQLAAATAFLDKIMRSDKGGIKSVNDGLAILMRAKDLNMPFSTAIEHIHVINGKTGVDIHVIKALLSRAGVTWRCINNYSPLYEYTDGINVYIDGKFPDFVERCKSVKEANEKRIADEKNGITNETVYIYPVSWYSDFSGNIYKSYNLTNKFEVAVNRQHADSIIKSGKIPIYRIANQPVDYITKYEFTRIINGNTVTAIGEFTYSEAQTAKLFEKDTYAKYPKILISHRAFTYGARDIASDVIMGCMETTELKIISGKELGNIELAEVEDLSATTKM
ncbi:MAG: RecT family protein [Bacteriophage sp.]|nr:MAG: RecT family protein [Bacteriophage sp.]